LITGCAGIIEIAEPPTDSIESEKNTIAIKQISPCDDENYILFKTMDIDSMTVREYQKYLHKEEECQTYKRVNASERPYIGFGASSIGGVTAFLGSGIKEKKLSLYGKYSTQLVYLIAVKEDYYSGMSYQESIDKGDSYYSEHSNISSFIIGINYLLKDNMFYILGIGQYNKRVFWKFWDESKTLGSHGFYYIDAPDEWSLSLPDEIRMSNPHFQSSGVTVETGIGWKIMGGNFSITYQGSPDAERDSFHLKYGINY